MEPAVKKRKVVVLEKSYDVESIELVKFEDGRLLFNVKWEGYNSSENTWEPFEHLENNIVFQGFVKQEYEKADMRIKAKIVETNEKQQASFDEKILESKSSVIEVLESFDKLQFKTWMVADQLLTEEEKLKAFNESVQEAIFNFSIKEYVKQERRKLVKLQNEISSALKIKLTIQNDRDFSLPDAFKYVKSNISNEKEKEDVNNNDKIGCGEDCDCTKKCCANLSRRRFGYKHDEKGREVLRLSVQEKIIECNNSCKCSTSCLNRVSQKPNDIEFVLFKTENRNWGVKSAANIHKGTFIVEYTGEMLSVKAAGELDSMYQFSMDTIEARRVIDAKRCGNLARFINHSCEPNASVWIVNDCVELPKTQRIW